VLFVQQQLARAAVTVLYQCMQDLLICCCINTSANHTLLHCLHLSLQAYSTINPADASPTRGLAQAKTLLGKGKDKPRKVKDTVYLATSETTAH
jgi:hypothetical protein